MNATSTYRHLRHHKLDFGSEVFSPSGLLSPCDSSTFSSPLVLDLTVNDAAAKGNPAPADPSRRMWVHVPVLSLLDRRCQGPAA